jgi:hypothetical protein
MKIRLTGKRVAPKKAKKPKRTTSAAAVNHGEIIPLILHGLEQGNRSGRKHQHTKQFNNSQCHKTTVLITLQRLKK